MAKRTKKYNPHKHPKNNPYVDFRFEYVNKSNLIPFYNQIFWMIQQLKTGKPIDAVSTKIGDEMFNHQIALKRIFLESYAVIETMRDKEVLTPETVENVNWLRDRINDIFAKMLEYVKFDDDGVEYWIDSDYSYLPKKSTIERMEQIVFMMFGFWMSGIRNYERAAGMWHGCLLMGVYLEKENRALHSLLKFDHLKTELERIFVKQQYLED